MSQIHNERTKLSANALDRTSTACIAVGVFGPAIAYLYGLGGTEIASRGILVLFGGLFRLVTAVLLHSVLGRLK